MPRRLSSPAPLFWRSLRSIACAAAVSAVQATCLAADPGDVAIVDPIAVTGAAGTPQPARIEPTTARPLSNLTPVAIKPEAIK